MASNENSPCVIKLKLRSNIFILVSIWLYQCHFYDTLRCSTFMCRIYITCAKIIHKAVYFRFIVLKRPCLVILMLFSLCLLSQLLWSEYQHSHLYIDVCMHLRLYITKLSYPISCSCKTVSVGNIESNDGKYLL